MAGRGPQTFNKKQKEQRRKEKQEEKLARRLERKRESHTPPETGAPPEPITLVGGDGEERP
jgi:hypothetical protein